MAALLARLAQSEARWAAARAMLPPALAAAARAGPLDDTSWVVLADHASAAAKLKLHAPDVDAALVAQGFGAVPMKVKVRPRVA